MLSRLQLPEKVHDILPGKCAVLRKNEQLLRELFLSFGFFEVKTPAYEYYDICTLGLGTSKELIKFIDKQGDVLALRPDFTIPITRMYAANLSGIQRLFYIGSAYTATPANKGSCEYTQAGVELIGQKGITNDVQTIVLAINSLIALGISDIKIDIGQVGFFKEIIAPLNLNPETAEKIRQCIDDKNASELDNILDKTQIESSIKDTLRQLIYLFGGIEIFERAEKLSPNEKCLKQIKYFKQLGGLLIDLGYGEYISFDLGLLHNYNYYTGIVFKGFSSGFGTSLLSGGRYDNLLSCFGGDEPAVGYAIDLQKIMQFKSPEETKTDYYILADTNSCAQAFEKQRELISNGKRAALYFDTLPNEISRNRIIDLRSGK